MSPPAAAGGATPHLLISFASHLGVACRTALRELDLPNLRFLLARLSITHEDRQDETSLSPPHERAHAHALGIDPVDGLIPWAALQARTLGLPGADTGAWGLLTLCHWQVGMSEVVLDDPMRLGLTPGDHDALLGATRPYFEEDGLAVFATPQPGQWLLCGPLLHNLPTAAIDRAVGQPLAPWLPMSEAARPLRRLQNEMQMLLYTTRVNDERAARGQAPINSFWLSGTGHAPPVATWALQPPIEINRQLRDSALNDDGTAWADAWQALDANELAAWRLRVQRDTPFTLTLCGDRAALRLEARASGLHGWLRGRLRRPEVAAVLEAL